MSNLDGVKNVVKLLNTGKSYPALQLVQSNAETAALISKMIRPVEQENRFDLRKKESGYALNQSQLSAISDSTKRRIRDSEYILQIFPDLELAVQILISSILSPKDMVKNDLIYRTNESILPSELTLKVLGIIQSHIEGHYKIKDDLQTILREALFTTGSYAYLVLPESLLDDIINNNIQVSTESLKELYEDPKSDKIKHLGLLGNPYDTATSGHAFESFLNRGVSKTYDPTVRIKENGKEIAIENFEIVDNFNMLRLPKIIEADNKARIRSMIRKKSVLNPATENAKLSNYELSTLLYKNQERDHDNFLVIPPRGNAKRKNVGRPLVMHIPSEAIIPVYVPGDETNHVGYFILVDGDGNPVSASSRSDNSEGLMGLLNNQGQNQSLSSLLLQKAKVNLAENDKVQQINNLPQIYANIIETNLMERLKKGLYGSNVAISENEEVYRIMLARALAGKFTRLVYVPGEMMTYIAFKYFANGVGKSYLDDIKNLMSIRAILLFARIMAMTKSAINVTKVNLKLDEHDPDPQKTIEIAMHEVVRMRQQYFPLGINSPIDLVDWIQRAGFEFTFEGHPGLPDTQFDFSSANFQHEVPPDDFDETLRKQTYMAFGLTPEMVDNGFNAEFATTVVQNNILLSKRVSQAQDIFCNHLSDLVRKICLSDAEISNEILDAIKDNSGLVTKLLTEAEQTLYKENPELFTRDIVDRFIETVIIELPRPDMTTIENQKEAFDQYMEALDSALNAYISSEHLPESLIGNGAEHVDWLKEVVKNTMARKWMGENNYMNELSDLVTSDEDGNPVFDLYEVTKNHAEAVIKSMLTFMKKMDPLKKAVNLDLENLNAEESSYTPPDDDTSDAGDSGGGSDDFGSMDFDMDFESEETASDETDETKTEETTETPADTGDTGGSEAADTPPAE